MGVKAFTIPSIFTAVDKVSATVVAMGKNIQAFATKAEVGLARAERGFRSLISPLTAVNRLMRGFGLYIGGYLVIRAVAGMIAIFADFEQANADLAAIMGTTVKANQYLAANAKFLGLTTAKTATEVVGLQIELAKLGFSGNEIVQMSAAIVSGSIALDAALDRTATLAGAMIRTFQKFTAGDTQHIMDVLSKASNDTALSFAKLETGLPIVAGAANAVGISFTRTVALLGALSNAGIDASMSATALRNIFIDSKKHGHSYEQVLGNIAKRIDTLTPAYNIFGKRTAVSAQILVRSLQQVIEQDKILQNVQLGYTGVLASQRLDTYRGSVTLLKSAYQGLILSIEDGTGPYANFLKRINQVGRAMLLAATGTETAWVEFFKMDKRIQSLAKTGLFWVKVIGWITAGIIVLKGIIIAGNIAFAVFQGIMYGLAGAIWLVNAALAANPVGLIIGSIIVLGTLVAGIIIKWNEWGAAISSVAGFLGGPIVWTITTVIGLIQSMRRNWDGIIAAFTNGGFVEGLKKIGSTIVDVVLMPLQQIMKIIANITGFEWAKNAVSSIERFRFSLGTNTETNESGQDVRAGVHAEAQRQYVLRQIMETTQRQKVSIDINDSTGRSRVSTEGAQIVPIVVTPTNRPWWEQ